MLFDCPLDDLDLLRDCRKLLLEQSVEFIKAAPSSTLDKTNEDPAHRLVVKPFVTIEHKYLASECLSKCLHTLSFTSSCRPIRITTEAHFHAQHQGQIAFVRQWRVHKLWRIALILEGVIEKGVAHANLGRLLLLRQLRSLINMIFELLIPHPIVGVLTGHDTLILCQLVNDINVMKDIQNEGLRF